MKKVLLVEDDNQITLTLGARLESMGYSLMSTSDVVFAAAQTKRHDPDIILVDTNLPGGDGFKVAERLRFLANVPTTPIIVITEQEGTEAEAKTSETGATAFVRKPFETADLTSAIDGALAA